MTCRECKRNPMRMFIVILAAAFPATTSRPIAAAEPPVLAVPGSAAMQHLAVPLPESMELDGRMWQLVEIDGAGLTLPAQIIPATAPDGTAAEVGGRLAVDIPPREGAGRMRRFRLEGGEQDPAVFAFEEIDGKSLKLSEKGAAVWTYNFGRITDESVPKSDVRRTRGSYVHPVWGLNGEVLTDDFPKDHYHHHGIFWAWPHVGIADKHYDLWLGHGIEIRFERWLHRQVGPVAAVLAVENGWYVGDKKVMTERVWLRSHRSTEQSRALDLEFVWIPTDQPITLWGADGKSYGGLTVRFKPAGRKETTITIPEGKTKDDLMIARLPWVDFTSIFGDATKPSGATVMVHPEHPDYPPTWLTRHYGPLCVGWPGVKKRTFQPGETIHPRYRFWTHKAAATLPEIQRAYDAYVAGEKAEWQ